MKTLFSNRYRFQLQNNVFFALCFIQIHSVGALADCRPGKFHLEPILEMPAKQLSQVLHDKTGCNFIFHPSYLDNKFSIVKGDYLPVTLINQLAKQLKSEVSVARTVLIVAPTKLPLKGTGKLVSLDLVDAPVDSVNQIIKKLGSEKTIAGAKESKLTISLYDVPLDDLATILEFQLSKTN